MLQVTPAEWAAIEAAGSGVLFREGEPVSWSDENGWTGRPPAEFVEAAQPCDHYGNPISGGGERISCRGCHNGKRRVAVVVPCERCEGRGFIVPTHAPWENVEERTPVRCPECVQYHFGADEIGFVTVGHVVVTWGPRRLVTRADRMEPGALLDIAVVMDHVLSFVTDRGTVATIPHSPDIDPQSLVGQYAIGVEVVT